MADAGADDVPVVRDLHERLSDTDAPREGRRGLRLLAPLNQAVSDSLRGSEDRGKQGPPTGSRLGVQREKRARSDWLIATRTTA